MTKRKIGILLNTSWYIYNFRRNLINSLIKDDFEIHAIAPFDDYSERLKSLGCIYHPLELDSKSKNPLDNLILLKRIRKVLNQVKPDVLLNFTIKPNVYGTLSASGLGIQCINNIAGRGTFYDESLLSRLIFKALFRISQRKAFWIFCQNPDDFQVLTKNKVINSNRTSLLPGSGVNLNEFCYTPVQEKEEVVFLLMARMIFPKGVEELITAARKLRAKSYHNFRIVLVGESGVNNPNAIPITTIQEYCELPYVEYLGMTDRVIPLIQNSDVMVLPSYYREGTPKSLLEALSIGRPVITTDMPGCKETVVDGENGFLCQPRSSDDLAEKMELILKMNFAKRLKMGEKSRELAELKFDESIVINEYKLKIKLALKDKS